MSAVSVLTRHWSFDPLLIVLALVALVHARGARHVITAVRRAGRPVRPFLGQAGLFYGGLLVVALAASSPLDYWSDVHLGAHVVQHVLLAFAAPPLIVIGAPWIPLLAGLPASWRRALGGVAQRTRSRGSREPSWALAGKVRRVLARPLVSIVGFNVAMVLWHIPGPFDLAATNQWVHIGLEHGSFFALGIAFWLQIFGSQPFRPVLPEPRRVAALISTNAVMVVVAASLVLFSKTAYPAYAAILGHSQQVADQQVGGAILWVCGELIFLPAILYLIAQWLREPERPMDVGVRTGSSASRGSVA